MTTYPTSQRLGVKQNPLILWMSFLLSTVQLTISSRICEYGCFLKLDCSMRHSFSWFAVSRTQQRTVTCSVQFVQCSISLFDPKTQSWKFTFSVCQRQDRQHSATYISIFEDSMLRSFSVDALVYCRMVIATLIHLKLNWVEVLDVSKRCTRAPSSSCSGTRQSNMANPPCMWMSIEQFTSPCWLAGGQPKLC